MKAPSKRSLRRGLPRNPGLRELALRSLGKEFGFSDSLAFLRAVRVASKLLPRTLRRKATHRPGASRIVRLRVAQMMDRNHSAMMIAIELGLPLRVVDRIFCHLERISRRRKRATGRQTARQLPAKRASLYPQSVPVSPRDLGHLPFQYGFKDAAEFSAAVKSAASGMTQR